MSKKLFALLAVALAPAAAHASSISSDMWYEFQFSNAGTPAYACLSCQGSSGTETFKAGPPPYTFDLATAGTLVVQDAFLAGDVFNVYDFGVLIGSTSSVTIDGSTCGDDPVVCATDPANSRGSFLLASGSHAISFTPTQTVPGGGAAYFELLNTTSSVTPEPSSFLLLGTGLLGAAGTLRRRFVS